VQREEEKKQVESNDAVMKVTVNESLLLLLILSPFKGLPALEM
jgi:hypothetical protein